MKHHSRHPRITTHYALLTLCSLLILLFPPRTFADLAPPQQPPGSSIDPGKATQVRMVSERVVLDVQSRPTGDQRPYLVGDAALAQVSASFQMHNLGSSDEHLQVRFPLGDPSGQGSGFGDFPQVQNFAANVNGQLVITTVITSTNPQGIDRQPVQWAAFDVDFPVAQDMPIDVTYTITPTGNFPKARFAYVLETGAGWRDTIGSADIIVRLPYAVSNENVFLSEGDTSSGSRFVGNEIRWHWNNLEPTAQDNIVASVLAPRVWQTILQAREAVAANSHDVEGLVHLALAYESAVTNRFPTDQHDPFAALSEQTFAQAVAAQPNSATLHASFAALLLQNLSVQGSLPPDDPVIQHILTEVSTALALDSQNAQAQDVYKELQQSVEGGNLPLVTPEISAPTAIAVSTVAPSVTPVPVEPTVATSVPTPPVPSPTAITLQSGATPTDVPRVSATPALIQETSPSVSSLAIGVIAIALVAVIVAVILRGRR